MSLTKLNAASGSFITRTLNTEMTRREFLQMGGALLLGVLGVQNILSIVAKHTQTTSPTPLIASDPNGFGSRKFGQ